MTTPTNDVKHKAFISIDAPPSPECGGIGASTLRADEVTCLACLELAADRRARIAAEVHDETDRDLCAKEDCGECQPVPAVDEPTKTHDLSIVRVHGNVVIEAEAETGSHLVYLQDGIALDLGRVLAALTPAQIALLVDDLTGGEK